MLQRKFGGESPGAGTLEHRKDILVRRAVVHIDAANAYLARAGSRRKELLRIVPNCFRRLLQHSDRIHTKIQEGVREQLAAPDHVRAAADIAKDNAGIRIQFREHVEIVATVMDPVRP